MTATTEQATINDIVTEVEVCRISVNPHQPRRHFSDEEITELSHSIREVGLIHPPLVRPLSTPGYYELISGERRFRAAKAAGLQYIPVLVRDVSTSLSAQAALVENIQRVDLDPMEIALALKRLMDEFALGQEELALRVGKKRSTIANYLRLLALPKVIRDSVHCGKVTMGHAKAILGLPNDEQRMWLHDLIIRDDLSVRDAEKAAQRLSQKAKKKTLSYANRDFYLEQLAEKVQQRLGTKVMIQGKGKKGRISIDYYNLDDLDRLLALFGVEGD
ncbi:MAG: ParB/RepB/Spo0J family partition protein [Chlamydiales bacterium]|nr:ParB/RepB/Spo0J family partition protein [Chlamydiia bacterium]MCP5507861.1 ParB/RepB/Spo0J family partition protein [Chlamydiales bacterium]